MAINPHVELISIGEELLIGKIANTNAQFLARRIVSLGGRVRRITVVGDDVDVIAETIRESLSRKPNLIITTGGLGPTFDDKTLEGIARALGRSLVLDDEALKMVKERYAHLSSLRGQTYELTPARLKMAKIPEGSSALHNPVGTAPGVLIKLEGCFLVALPGVPSEMEAIFEESIAPIIRNLSKSVFHEKSLRVEGIFESDLAPLIDVAMRENATVYVKSHPRMEEGKGYIELHLTTSSETLEKAKESIERTAEILRELIQQRGGSILPQGTP
ncbi:MAG: nicotinamide mononucleotide deamidase-related protein [Candidatus Bathyarchaeia archaeon]